MEPTKRRLTGQLRTVLAHLIQHGTITNLEAMLTLGVGRLASRISELRALGVIIINGHPEAGKRYAAYSLGDKVAACALLAKGAPPNVTLAGIIQDASQSPNNTLCAEAVSPVNPSNGAAPACISEGAAGRGGTDD